MVDVTTVLNPMVPGNPSHDNSDAFNQLIRNEDALFIPKGNYYFLKPPEAIEKTISICGNSMSSSVFIRNYHVGAAFEGFIKLVGGYGSRIENLSLLAGGNTNQGVGLTLEAQKDGRSADFSVLRNLNISGVGGTGNWNIALWLHGALRRDSPKGLRDLHIENVYLFASTYAALDINTVHDASILASCYPAGGGTDLIRINAWPEDPCNNILLQLRTRAYLDARNINHSKIIAPSYAGSTLPSSVQLV